MAGFLNGMNSILPGDPSASGSGAPAKVCHAKFCGDKEE